MYVDQSAQAHLHVTFKRNPHLFELLNPVTLTSETMMRIPQTFEKRRECLLISSFLLIPSLICFFPFLDVQVLQPRFQKSHRTLRLSSLLLRVLACHGAGYGACQSPLVSVSAQPLLLAQNSWLSHREWRFLLGGGEDMLQGLPAA